MPADERDDLDISGDLDVDGDDFDPAEYGTMVELERLESLEEEMMELGVTTLEAVRARVAALHKELDAGE